MSLNFLTCNTILYCRQWDETVNFYENKLELIKSFSSDWFVEFRVTDTARISLANQNRTSIRSVDGQGVTVTWQVHDIERAWQNLRENGVETGDIITHAWGARLFRFYDPEKHRLEIWSVGNND